MENFWRGWKITAKQVTAIKNGDIEARNRFYIDNLSRIQSMARNYVRKRHMASVGREYDVDDCVNCVYLDLPLFNFENGKTLSHSLINSFCMSIYGGLWYVTENDSKLFNGEYRGERLYILDRPLNVKARTGETSETGALYIDSVASTPSPESDLIGAEIVSSEKVVEITSKYLSPKENEIFSLLLDGYSVYAIPELLGLKNVTKQYARIKARLCTNYEPILKAIEKLGAELPQYAQERPERFAYSYDFLNKHKKRCAYSNLTPEQKAKAVERKRLWRERKRAEKQA